MKVKRQLIAVIDKRTTVVCLDCAGQIVGAHEPFRTLMGDLWEPPFHVHCRSMVVPWVAGWGEEHQKAALTELLARPRVEVKHLPPAPHRSAWSRARDRVRTTVWKLRHDQTGAISGQSAKELLAATTQARIEELWRRTGREAMGRASEDVPVTIRSRGVSVSTDGKHWWKGTSRIPEDAAVIRDADWLAELGVADEGMADALSRVLSATERGARKLLKEASPDNPLSLRSRGKTVSTDGKRWWVGKSKTPNADAVIRDPDWLEELGVGWPASTADATVAGASHEELAESYRRWLEIEASDAQREAFTRYTMTSAYQRWNPYMRGLEADVSANDLSQIEDVRALLASSPRTQNPITVYRGVKDGDSVFGADALAPGSTFVDRAFVSTTMDDSVLSYYRGAGDGNALVKIRVPSGSKIGVAETEGQVVLPPGTVLRVVSDRTVTEVASQADYDMLAGMGFEPAEFEARLRLYRVVRTHRELELEVVADG